MPRMTIDDLKRLATAHTIKAQKYREAAVMLHAASEQAYVLRHEGRRHEAIADALQMAVEVKAAQTPAPTRFDKIV